MSSSALRATTPDTASSASPSVTPSTPRASALASPRGGAAWYRREPWLAVSLLGFVPIGVGFFTPQSVHVPLLAMAGLLVLVGIGLLVRQGATRG